MGMATRLQQLETQHDEGELLLLWQGRLRPGRGTALYEMLSPAITSANMETAISSGLSAAISIPIGVAMRSNSSVLIPDPMSFSLTTFHR